MSEANKDCKHRRGWWCEDCHDEELVEAAVRATIEACAVDLGDEGFGLAAQFIRTADPAPIVKRVLGGEK